MTGAGEQQLSHADRHDLDKLARWKAGLDAAADAEAFPACAIFLVSPEDRASHDIFRRFRSAFENLGAGFHHLVIFGQHGVSTTQVAFLHQIGLGQGTVPLLALVPMPNQSDAVYCIELPKGDRDGDLDETQTWADGLRAVEATARRGGALSLEGPELVQTGKIRSGSLSDAVDAVLTELSSEA